MTPRFAQRSSGIEIMDNLDCAGDVVFQTLRELETINQLLGGNPVTISGLRALLRGKTQKRFSIVDLGCGSGDMLRRINRWGNARNLDLTLTGIDANQNIIGYARDHTAGNGAITYAAMNIFSDEFRAQRHDIVLATLFMHHFSDAQLIETFSSLARTTRVGIVVNDIHRHWLAYYSIRWLTQFFSRSDMVKFDAPLSVLRAFRRAELERILYAAGIRKYTLRWCWAFRWQLVIPTTQAEG